MKAAREKIARGESLVPDGSPPGLQRARNADGTFAGPSLDGLTAADDPAAIVDPNAPPADPNAPPDPNALPLDDAPDPELIVALPGRRPEDGDVELVAADKETAERLRQLRNGFTRGEEARAMIADAQAQMQEVNAFATALDVDPIGVIEQRQYAPEQRANLVLSMLTQPEVYAMVKDILPMLADPKEFRYVAAEVENDRNKQRTEATTRIETQRAVQANVQEVSAAIDALIPDGLSEIQRQVFIQDARADVGRFANARGLLTLDPVALPQVLAARLQAHGMDTAAAHARLARVQPGASAPVRPATRSAAPPAPAAPAAAPAPAGRTAEEIRAAADKRRQVAAIGPQGAGAPAMTTQKPPAGATLKEASAFARQRSGVRPR